MPAARPLTRTWTGRSMHSNSTDAKPSSRKNSPARQRSVRNSPSLLTLRGRTCSSSASSPAQAVPSEPLQPCGEDWQGRANIKSLKNLGLTTISEEGFSSPSSAELASSKAVVERTRAGLKTAGLVEGKAAIRRSTRTHRAGHDAV